MTAKDMNFDANADMGAVHSRIGLRRYLATSDRQFPTWIRKLYKRARWISIPAPWVIVRPILRVFVAIRWCYHFGLRVFVCEPLFKAYCKEYGRGLHTGCYIHWIQGQGDLIVGENVTIGGKCSISFAARFSDHPMFKIGDNTGIGHGCNFAIGKHITIGRNCSLSGDIWIADSNGHPTDVEGRLADSPPSSDDVRPVVIGDGVWVGRNCMIFPGVKIGEGSVVSAGSVVRGHVPPYSVVAGNPAKVVFRLKRPNPDGDTPGEPRLNGLQRPAMNGESDCQFRAALNAPSNPPSESAAKSGDPTELVAATASLTAPT